MAVSWTSTIIFTFGLATIAGWSAGISGFASSPCVMPSSTMRPSPWPLRRQNLRRAGGYVHSLRATAIDDHQIGESQGRRSFLAKASLCAVALPLAAIQEASAIVSPLQRYTDECEIDACINRDKRVFTRAGRKFNIKQEFDKNGSKSTGSAVWEGAVVLTKFMENDLPKDYWKGKKVLELGAGIGLEGMVAVVLGAARVVLTDGDAKVLDLAKVNAEANLKADELSYLSYQKLRWEWAADSAWKYDDGDKKDIDVILAADLTYYKDNIPPLIRMIKRLCTDKTEVLLTHTVRPTDGDSMQQFYKFFEVEKIDKGPSFEGHPETFLYRMRNKASVDMDASSDGCRPGYFKKKDINLCVPLPAQQPPST